MSFNATLTTDGKNSVIKLEGELDAMTAETFHKEVERAAEDSVEQLVLDMSELSYISSAGLRVLIFTRQKLDDGIRIILAGARDTVQQTIRLGGFHNGMEFSDAIPE